MPILVFNVESVVVYIVSSEVAPELSRFCKMARRSKAVGPRWGRWSSPVGPQTNDQDPPKWNMKHHKSMEFLSFSMLSPPLHKINPLYERLSGDGPEAKQYVIT